MVETYLSATLAALILLMPLVIWRMERTTWAVAILTDVLLVCNLMYFRTYYTAILRIAFGGRLKSPTPSSRHRPS